MPIEGEEETEAGADPNVAEVPPMPEAPVALQIADLKEQIKHLEQVINTMVTALNTMARSRPPARSKERLRLPPMVKPKAKATQKPLAKKKAKRR